MTAVGHEISTVLLPACHFITYSIRAGNASSLLPGLQCFLEDRAPLLLAKNCLLYC